MSINEMESKIAKMQECKNGKHLQRRQKQKRKALSDEIEGLRAMADEVEMETYKYYNDPEWQLPEPKALTGAKTYKEKTAAPFVEKLKNVIIALVSKIKDLMREYNRKLHELQSERSYSRRLEQRNQVLQRDSDILQTIRDEIGNDGVEEILDRAQQRAEEEAELYEQERASHNNEWDLSL